MEWIIRWGVCAHLEVPVRDEALLRRIPEIIDPTLCQPLRPMLIAQVPHCHELWVHKPCLHNELRGVRGRVLGVVPVAAEGIHKWVLELSQEIPRQLVLRAVDGLETLISVFPENRRKRYREALDSILESGVVDNHKFISAFVKCEKLEILRTQKDPRIIQARKPEFNLMFGLYTRSIELGLYHLVDPCTQIPLIAKGMNLDEKAQALQRLWNLYLDPVSISFDLSRWDMHCGEEVMSIMQQTYLQVIRDPLFESLLQAQALNRGFTSHGVSYKVPWGVMSGDMTTALGNCVAVCAVLLAYRVGLRNAVSSDVKQPRCPCNCGLLGTNRELLSTMCVPKLGALFRSVEKQWLPENWFSILDDGDDHVVITERKYAPILEQTLPHYWHLLGHKLTVEPLVDKLHLIQFCQHKPLRINGVMTMVPNPRKVIAKAMSVGGVYLNNPKPYLKTVMRMRAEMHVGVPVLGPLFTRLYHQISGPELGDKSRERLLLGLEIQHKRLARSHSSQKVGDQERLEFAEAWQMPEEVQWELERLNLGSLAPAEAVEVHPVTIQSMEVDLPLKPADSLWPIMPRSLRQLTSVQLLRRILIMLGEDLYSPMGMLK